MAVLPGQKAYRQLSRSKISRATYSPIRSLPESQSCAASWRHFRQPAYARDLLCSRHSRSSRVPRAGPSGCLFPINSLVKTCKYSSEKGEPTFVCVSTFFLKINLCTSSWISFCCPFFCVANCAFSFMNLSRYMCFGYSKRCLGAEFPEYDGRDS